ncbi:MAG: GPI inositol-deacylase [Gammaproteobacteria bacterium]|nr:GPI inositol-deacylase [Gammaproteobacteria bacterium]
MKEEGNVRNVYNTYRWSTLFIAGLVLYAFLSQVLYAAVGVDYDKKITLQKTVIDEQPYSTDVGKGTWEIKYSKPKYTFVMLDGISIPVPFHTEKYVAVNDVGTTVWGDDEFASLVETPLDEFELSDDFTYTKRPTLFISIPGFQPIPEEVVTPVNVFDLVEANYSINGGRFSSWQDTFNGLLLDYYSANDDAQYKHFFVRWDTIKSMRLQVEALAEKINRFLSMRKYKWDVVIVGHSRGGIITHRLTKYIIDNPKINKMYTYLLDPTAALALGDVYPAYLPTYSTTEIYGEVIYDGNRLVTYGGITFDLGAQASDRDIPGYKTTVMSSATHETIHGAWLGDSSNGAKPALERILNSKEVSLYTPDGTLGMSYLDIRHERNYDLFTDIGCYGSQCFASGEFTIDGFSVYYADVEFGSDGVEVAYGGLNSLYQAHYIIKRDQLYAAETVGVPGNPILQVAVSAGISKRGIEASARYWGLRGGLAVNKSELIYIDFDAFGIIEGEFSAKEFAIDYATVYYGELIGPVTSDNSWIRNIINWSFLF